MSLFEYERDGNVSELAGLLEKSEIVSIRKQAAEALGRMGGRDERKDVIGALVKAAREDDAEEVVAAAVDGLEELGQDALETLLERMTGVEFDEEVSDRVKANAFVKALGSDIPQLRMAAANALGQLEAADAVTHLLTRFDDPDPRVRARAARATGSIADPRATDALIGLLGDPTAPVRKEAANALGEIGNRRALQALLEMYDDENEQIRRIAVSGLGKFDNERPVEYLIDALTDDARAVRRAAVYSMIDLLSNVPRELSHEIREQIVSRLSTDGDDAIIEPLIHILKRGRQASQRRNTAWLLGRILEDDSNREAVDALCVALLEGEKMTQQFAATSLADLGGTYTESKLLELAKDESVDTEARAQAIFALGKIGDRDTSDELKEILDQTEDDTIQQRTLSALSKLGGLT